jgi:hypothetical protein
MHFLYTNNTTNVIQLNIWLPLISCGVESNIESACRALGRIFCGYQLDERALPDVSMKGTFFLQLDALHSYQTLAAHVEL